MPENFNPSKKSFYQIKSFGKNASIRCNKWWVIFIFAGYLTNQLK
jgi:hypothetical protein